VPEVFMPATAPAKLKLEGVDGEDEKLMLVHMMCSLTNDMKMPPPNMVI
jgi:hypothetical protein